MTHAPAQKTLILFLGLATIAGLLILFPPMTLASIPDDDTIAKTVTSALSSDPVLGKRTIEVFSYRGRVGLVGFVENQKEMDRAIELAKQIDGVQSVQNNLMYLDPNGFNVIPRSWGFQSP